MPVPGTRTSIKATPDMSFPPKYKLSESDESKAKYKSPPNMSFPPKYHTDLNREHGVIIKPVPDLSFPPKYTLPTFELSDRSVRKSPPDFSFPPKYDLKTCTSSFEIRSIPTGSKSMVVYNITNGNPPQEVVNASPSRSLNTATSPEATLDPTKGSPLLDLPYEIRLQIYDYVLNTNPIHHAHLACSPSPTSTTTSTLPAFHKYLHPQGFSLPTTTNPTLKEKHPHQRKQPRTRTIQGKVPTGLLASCKQIYEETHMLPFEQNVFTFVNWYWSGVYAAREFMRGLRDWQRVRVRWVGVEVLARDLEDQQTRSIGVDLDGEWKELCALWSGVEGLRLGIRGSVIPPTASVPSTLAEAVNIGGVQSNEIDGTDDEELQQRGVLNVNKLWIRDGLCRMTALRWVEVEVEDVDVKDDVKVQFCGDLDGILNRERGSEDGIRVLLIERSQVEEETVGDVEDITEDEFMHFEGGNVVPWGFGGV